MTLRWLILPLTAFAVTLAVLVGLKLDGESLALLTGVGLGMLASLPGYLVLFRLTNWKPPDSVTPQKLPPYSDAATTLLPPSLAAPRHFTVIGVDSIDVESNPFTSVPSVD